MTLMDDVDINILEEVYNSKANHDNKENVLVTVQLRLYREEGLLRVLLKGLLIQIMC